MFCTNCGTKLKDHAKFCDECAYPVKGTEKLKRVGQPESITGLWLDYVAMRSHFHFSLQEKDGVVLFSYDYLKIDGGFIEKENVPVAPAYMRELRELVKENGYAHLKAYEPERYVVRDRDEPSCHLELKWADYKPLLICSTKLPPNGDKLKEFFISIAENIQQNV